MKIRTFNDIYNDKYRVTKHTEDFSEADLLLLASYGEPEINLGGTFGADPAFTLPDDLEKLKTGSPFTYRFDGRDHDLSQVTTITVKAGGDAPATGGLYFDIDAVSGAQYRVWFDENNTDTPPADGGRTLVEVDTPLAGTNEDVATALAAALDTLVDFAASSAAGTVSGEFDVIATDTGFGPVVDPDPGTTTTTELVFEVTTQGDSAQYRAETWDVEISSRLTAALVEHRLLMDTFTGERVENV